LGCCAAEEPVPWKLTWYCPSAYMFWTVTPSVALREQHVGGNRESSTKGRYSGVDLSLSCCSLIGAQVGLVYGKLCAWHAAATAAAF
jgi:hypothetical protein